MGNGGNDADARVNDIKNKFVGYYSAESDLFGNNIDKPGLTGQSVMFHYINFFKTCRIVEKLFLHGFSNLPEYRILDAGCGNGQDLRTLVEFGAKPENCHGIDFSEAALAAARRMSPPEMEFRQVPFLDNGYETGTFDIVFSYNTITNYPEDRDIMDIGAEFRRLLQPNGVLLLICTIDNTPKRAAGVAGLVARTFTMDDIKKFFPQFEIKDACSASVLKDNFEKNIVITDQLGNKANMGVLFNWGAKLQEQQSYNQFYVNGALKHLVYGMEIIKSGLKLLVLRPS